MYLLSKTAKKICMGSVIAGLACATIAWAPFTNSRKEAMNQFQDTIPGKNHNKNYQGEPKDIDQQIEELDRVMKKFDNELEGKGFEEMQQKLEESISKIDMRAIQNKIDESIQKIDLDKLQLDATIAMKKIDWEKIQRQIQDAIEKTKDDKTIKKLQQQLQETIKEAEKNMKGAKKIDYDKIKVELDKNREQMLKEKVNVEKVIESAKESLNNNKETLQKKLSNAREEIIKAKDELQSYKTMIALMEKDGLLNSKEDYKIDYQDGSLMINGKKQTQEVLDSYKSYLKKEDLHIKKEKGNFSINSDN